MPQPWPPAGLQLCVRCLRRRALGLCKENRILLGATSSDFLKTSSHSLSSSHIRCLSTTTPLADSTDHATTHSSGINVFRNVKDLRRYRQPLLLREVSVGLVPTMGALHQGHLSLIRQAAEENSQVFVSIYVNPTQFGLNEDLEKYPKTFDTDLEKLHRLNEELGARHGHKITAVFAPTTKEMYPLLPPTSELDGDGSFVTITPLGKILEGASRPVFFRGVATICMKLFNIVQPTRVYFGQKDAQQSVLIRRLIRDFHINTELRVLPTERDADGMAMSSRNVFLGSRRREAALALPEALKLAENQYLKGVRNRNEILEPSSHLLKSRTDAQGLLPQDERAQFEVDYISLADPDTMEEVEMVDEKKGAILSAAIKMLPLDIVRTGEDRGLMDATNSPVRLIDNIMFEPILPVR